MKSKALAILIALVFRLMTFLPIAHAVVPTPDGCYPGFTTAEGCNALNFLTTGVANTGLGWRSLFLDSTGSFNTGVGAGTLVLNTADSNTAVGAAALLLNTTGTENTAVGSQALLANTEGHGNTAIGASALSANTTDGFNTATGADALLHNTSGLNTANGADALFSNTQGNTNTAIGYHALFANTTGVGNLALGGNAGDAQTTGNYNVYIGDVAGVAGESSHTYIRNINFTSVSGGGTDTVTVNLTTGLLGHLTSSRRYKEEIKPMDKASEALYRLKPVTYRYKKEIDPTQSPAFGLIAEEVAQVNHELVACNAEGQPESVHYEMVNAMLLNEFLKEHKKVEEQGEIIAKQQKQIEALTAGLQRVSDQIEMRSPARRVVAENP